MIWQDTLTQYFDAAFSHSAGDYRATRQLLNDAADGAPASANADFSRTFSLITSIAAGLNTQLLEERYRSTTDHRHPRYTGDPLLTIEKNYRAFDRVDDFYSVAIAALGPQSPEDENLCMVRNAILCNYPGEAAAQVAARLAHRFERRRSFAKQVLRTRSREDEASAGAIEDIATAGLDGRGTIPAFVLSAFFQAHINRYNVEHERSVPIGVALAETRAEVEGERTQLQQSVALLTFCVAVCLNCPWVFSESPDERLAIMDPETAGDASTSTPRWLARQLLLLSIYRRAHVFRLLEDPRRSYNDLRKVQRMSRLERVGRPDKDPRNMGLNTLEMLAEFRIGELYRADHDASQALVHLCRSHDLLHDQQHRAGVKESELFQVHIRLSKGKAFLEVGAVKRALKWFVRAWISLRELTGITTPRKTPLAVRRLDDYLEGVKHAPELNKAELIDVLGRAVNVFCGTELPDHTHDALAADVLIRIAHVLLVFRLETGGRPTHAEKLLKRAIELDQLNLLAWGGLLRCELRSNTRLRHKPPDPLQCWPSGANDVDQAIRAGEYLMLKRVRDARGKPHSRDADPRDVHVARELLHHFHTHTDSINLRLGILHRYLMQPRADARQEQEARRDERDHEPPRLEFVCLRRYGSFHPLMPRPAAVSAVGGGYLVRVFSPYVDPVCRAFNVLIDPGDGVVTNLYRAGLAISDVDMVIVTHDHSDHLGALDAILSLRHERRDRGSNKDDPRMEPASHAHDVTGDLDAGNDTRGRMLILGNHSVVNRYSFLNGGGDCVVLHIDDASAQRCPQIASRRIVITSLPTKHPDLGKQNAVGFVLELRPTSSPPLRIAFMSDTEIQGLGTYDGPTGQVTIDHDRWTDALSSDIVVAHVSDTPSGELRHLADFPGSSDTSAEAFDACIVGLLENGRDEEATELMQALSLIRPRSDHDQQPSPLGLLDRGFLETMEPWKHLFLHGLLAVAKRMRAIEDGKKRVLVVGELREQLGSFRGTIAREINEHVFDGPLNEEAHRPVALTADIGLRIRLAAEGQLVHCSTCALNNDRLPPERYHPPEAIREVCVKGDQEALYWNCPKHDPSKREPAVFVEQMGSYDPFSVGGRFHG